MCVILSPNSSPHDGSFPTLIIARSFWFPRQRMPRPLRCTCLLPSLFKYKIISKNLADKLASIMLLLISKEQKWYIHGRNIQDCTCLASEAINVFYNKNMHGNLALTVDIDKALDTISWDFLLKVLSKFGFNQIFYNWIRTFLFLARLSINFNGVQHGYFKWNRGFRQGDPTYPFLFYLAKDVLSRSLSKLVSHGGLDLIRSSTNNFVLSHIFYANDILIFCTGKMSDINALKNIFQEYSMASG